MRGSKGEFDLITDEPPFLEVTGQNRPMRRRVVAGIFVGGAARRMGGVPKGLLAAADGEPIVDRWMHLFDALGVPPVLVGERAEYLPRAMLPDAMSGCGPLGGLVALLRHAGDALAITVACDMPRATPALVERLACAPDAIAVAPRREGRWEPMFARYDSARARACAERRLLDGAHSLHGLLDELCAAELALSPDEARQLEDWDTLADIGRSS